MRRPRLWSLLAAALLCALPAFFAEARAALQLTEIEEGAFFGDASLTELELSESIQFIGAEAFAGCTGLKMLKCPSMDVFIDENAFAGDDQLQIFCYLHSTLDEYARENDIPRQYYDACQIACDTVNNGCAGLPIEWTVSDAMPGESVSSVFSYQIYNGETLLQSFAPSANTVVAYTPRAEGEYWLEVTVTNELTATTLRSEPVSVAEELYLGTYEQDGNAETADPLQWRILAVSGKKAFVITDKIIRVNSYFNPSWIKYKYTYWSGSYVGTEPVNYRGSAPESDATRVTGITPTSIPMKDGSRGVEADLYPLHARYWCNSVFYPSAFTDEEKERILLTRNVNHDNPKYGVDGGKDTDDYVFFLSYDEINAYMPSKNDRICDYTKVASGEIRSGKERLWWLRTPGKFRVNAMYVHASTGSLSVAGSDVGHKDLGYRPAMWITIGG